MDEWRGRGRERKLRWKNHGAPFEYDVARSYVYFHDNEIPERPCCWNLDEISPVAFASRQSNENVSEIGLSGAWRDRAAKEGGERSREPPVETVNSVQAPVSVAIFDE